MRTCSVPHCGSKYGSGVTLHKFPKTEIGLKKWLACLGSVKLNELSIKDLQNKYVCQKHFEKRFYTSSHLRTSAYPTLFSQEEIITGIPALAFEDNENQSLHDHDYTARGKKRTHNDHSYCGPLPLKELKPTEISASDYNMPSTSALEKPDTLKSKHFIQDFNMPSTSAVAKPDTLNSELHLIPDFGRPTASVVAEITVEKPATLNSLHQMKKAQSRIPLLEEAKTKRNFYADAKAESNAQYKKLLIEYQKAKKQLNYANRIKKALKFTKKVNFEKLTSNMNPIARKFLWLQVHSCTKKTKGRRFSNEEKIIALAIMKQSPKSYKFLRRIFILPSGRTINKLVSTLKVDSGINPQIFKAIETEVKNWSEAKKYCSIIFDEVALEPGLAYDEHKDKISGFVELDTKSNIYADHALVFMVRGALHKWQQPICYYFCAGATSAVILKTIIKEVTAQTIKTGLVPLALISDQGSAFQSALNKLKDDTRRQQILQNKNIDDTIMIEGHTLSIIYDPPHLIKGLRNNFLNKNIVYEDNISKWSDIIEVYNTDCKHADMRMLHKLNDEHVIPEKIKKMKVKNCTRVLSKTVASALAYTANFSHYADGKEVSPTLKNTSETISFFDDLFDSCNGSAVSIKNKGKPLRQGVTNNTLHHEFWKTAIKRLEKTKFVDINNKETTVPSQKNFIITVKSLIRLWDFFKTKGLKIMRPRYLNSDPIENFFGQVRAYSFRNNDPNCQAFKNIFRSLLITRFIHFHSESYNCEDTIGDQIIKLKNLFDQNPEERGIPTSVPLSSLQIDELESPTEDIINEARRERLNVHSRAYTAGWVVLQCTKKFKCVDCKKSLTQENESAIHKWISHREYKGFKNNFKLTYPSEHAVRYFSSIVKETNEYLDANPNSNNICVKIYKEISKYSFDFLTCLTHKRAVQEYFVSVSSKLCVINWCNTINKILRGIDVARLNPQQITFMQAKALEKYKKKLKNKNPTK